MVFSRMCVYVWVPPEYGIKFQSIYKKNSTVLAPNRRLNSHHFVEVVSIKGSCFRELSLSYLSVYALPTRVRRVEKTRNQKLLACEYVFHCEWNLTKWNMKNKIICTSTICCTYTYVWHMRERMKISVYNTMQSHAHIVIRMGIFYPAWHIILTNIF